MQSRTRSFIEAATNVAVGFGLAVLTQMLVFPVFGLVVQFDPQVSIAMIFMIVSLLRGYLQRSRFNCYGRASRPSTYFSHRPVTRPITTWVAP